MKNRSNRTQMMVLIRALPMLLFAVAGTLVSNAQQATPTPPNQMSYQGFLTDANGVALAPNSPTNYNVYFRIYNASTGSTNAALWGELQTVTVDKGYFSIVLGQGSPISGTVFSSANGGLPAVFTNTDASVRYMGLTVQGLNPNGGDVEIQPRLRLLPSGYAFLAANANALISSTTGAPLVTTVGSSVGINQAPSGADALDVTGNVTITGTLSANLSASQLSTGTLPTAVFGAGSVPATALPSNLQTLNNNNGSSLTALNASQLTSGTVSTSVLPTSVTTALCPAGSIMPYMGSTAPTGWLLCNGAPVSRSTYSTLFGVLGTASGSGDGSTTFNLPDLRGVFLRGYNGSQASNIGDPDAGQRTRLYSGGNTGNAIGSYQGDQFLTHQHIVPYGENSGAVNFNTWGYLGGNDMQGSHSSDDDNSWPYTSPPINSSGSGLGGDETRPRNVYVNYIIKY